MQNLTIHCETTENSYSFDYDVYNVSYYSSMSTKEYRIQVDFKNKSITGKAILYGVFGPISQAECIEVLELVKKNKKLRRDYKDLIK